MSSLSFCSKSVSTLKIIKNTDARQQIKTSEAIRVSVGSSTKPKNFHQCSGLGRNMFCLKPLWLILRFNKILQNYFSRIKSSK